MNKSELIDAIAKKTGLTKDAAAKAVNAYTEAVTEALKAGDKIMLAGFGTYEVKVPPASRTIRAPALRSRSRRPRSPLSKLARPSRTA